MDIRCVEHHGFSNSSMEIIDHIKDVLTKYRNLGYDLTVRQLYYQLVSANIIPNSVKSYNRIVRLTSKGRRSGLLDWDMLIDRGRPTKTFPRTMEPEYYLNLMARNYTINRWDDQPCHIEIMCEKQALEGVIAPICWKYQVNFTSNKGYSSDSSLYRMARRMLTRQHMGKDLHIIYLGDHDPSGMDMDRDIENRIDTFSEFQALVDFHRVALTMDQIEKVDPPPNPAKLTDSRAPDYILEYGESSWELDALDPQYIEEIVIAAIEDIITPKEWEATKRSQDKIRARMLHMIDDEWNAYEQK